MFTTLDKQAFDIVKAQMEIKTISIKRELKDLEKRERKGSYVSCTKIDELQNLQRIYSPKYVLPVKFEGLIINYKLLLDFLKRIKKYDTKFMVEDGELKVEYIKERGAKGILHLGDLTHYYQGFRGIPQVNLTEEEVAYGA